MHERMMRPAVAGMFFVGLRVGYPRHLRRHRFSFRCSFSLAAFVVLFRSSGRSLLLRRFDDDQHVVLWCAVTCIWSIDPALSAQYWVVNRRSP